MMSGIGGARVKVPANSSKTPIQGTDLLEGYSGAIQLIMVRSKRQL